MGFIVPGLVACAAGRDLSDQAKFASLSFAGRYVPILAAFGAGLLMIQEGFIWVAMIAGFAIYAGTKFLAVKLISRSQLVRRVRIQSPSTSRIE